MSKRTVTEAERQEALFTWLTPAQAGHRAGVSADTIVAAVGAGELKARDMSAPGTKRRRLKIRPDWLDAWLDSRTLNADAA